MCVNKIKKGDYVVCIKPPEGKANFKINNLYEIYKIYSDGYILLKVNDRMSYCGFELLEQKSNRYFFNYFATLQYFRKLKLEKINEKR